MNNVKRLHRIFITALTVAALFISPIKADIWDQVYSHRENDKMMIALTFDDGPHPKYTPQILGILAKYKIKATFFTVGENVALYPEAVESCIKNGHEIANHTYTHKDLSKDSFEDICREIRDTEKVLYESFEVRPKLLRPPGGLYNRSVILASDKLDYTLVLWNIDTKDWAHTPSDTIVKNVLTNVKAGDIILMHDYISKDSPTPAALDEIIPALIKKGYNFVTVSELLGCK